MQCAVHIVMKRQVQHNWRASSFHIRRIHFYAVQSLYMKNAARNLKSFRIYTLFYISAHKLIIDMCTEKFKMSDDFFHFFF